MTGPLSVRHKLLYGVGAVAIGVKENGLQLFLMIYYGQVHGLSEAWVGLGLMIALFIDAVGDPLIGHISDRLHTKWGRRHPLIYAGAIPAAVAYFFLWNPPLGLSSVELFGYLVTLLVLVRSFISLCEIPSAALTPEMTSQYDERTDLMSYRFLFGWGGGLLMGMAAFGYFLRGGGSSPGIVQMDGYRAYSMCAAAVIAGSALLSAWGTHGLIPRLRESAASFSRSSRTPRLRDLSRLVGIQGNPALLISTILGMTVTP